MATTLNTDFTTLFHAISEENDATTVFDVQSEQSDVTTSPWGNSSITVAPYNDSGGDTVDDAVSLEADLHMRIVYLIIGVLGMSGNGVVAFVILKTRSMRRTFPNMFIVNQSALDFTASLLIIATTYIHDITLVGSEIGKDLFCRLWLTNLPLWGVFVSSTYNLVCLTYERYNAIVHPLKHGHVFTRRKLYFVFGVVWFVGPAFNAAYMIPSSGMQGDDKCSVFTVWPSQTWQKVTGIVTVLLQYFIPLGLITYAYGRIAYVLKKSGQTHKSEDKKPTASASREDRLITARKNIIKTLALVGAAFIFCWSWNQIYYTMFNLGYDADLSSTFYHFTVVAVFCNCCLNPFIYALKYDQFQKATKRVFTRGSAEKESGTWSGVTPPFLSRSKTDMEIATIASSKNGSRGNHASPDDITVNTEARYGLDHPNEIV